MQMKWSLLILALAGLSCSKELPEEWAGGYFVEENGVRFVLMLHPDGRAFLGETHESKPEIFNGQVIWLEPTAPKELFGKWSYDDNVILFHFRDQDIKFEGVELDLLRDNGRLYKKGNSISLKKFKDLFDELYSEEILSSGLTRMILGSSRTSVKA